MFRQPHLPIEFKVDQKEWDNFWRWIYTYTSIHHLGPEVMVLDIGINRVRELSMVFFLLNKDRIFTNPPKCICKNRYIHVDDHLKNCPIKVFNDELVKNS